LGWREFRSDNSATPPAVTYTITVTSEATPHSTMVMLSAK
jgi:hypothetical protein